METSSRPTTREMDRSGPEGQWNPPGGSVEACNESWSLRSNATALAGFALTTTTTMEFPDFQVSKWVVTLDITTSINDHWTLHSSVYILRMSWWILFLLMQCFTIECVECALVWVEMYSFTVDVLVRLYFTLAKERKLVDDKEMRLASMDDYRASELVMVHDGVLFVVGWVC